MTGRTPPLSKGCDGDEARQQFCSAAPTTRRLCEKERGWVVANLFKMYLQVSESTRSVYVPETTQSRQQSSMPSSGPTPEGGRLAWMRPVRVPVILGVQKRLASESERLHLAVLLYTSARGMGSEREADATLRRCPSLRGKATGRCGLQSPVRPGLPADPAACALSLHPSFPGLLLAMLPTGLRFSQPSMSSAPSGPPGFRISARRAPQPSLAPS